MVCPESLESTSPVDVCDNDKTQCFVDIAISYQNVLGARGDIQPSYHPHMDVHDIIVIMIVLY